MLRCVRTCGVVIVALLLAAGMAGAAKTKISFWSNYSETENLVFEQQVVPLFENRNPDIDVEVVRLDYDALRDKIVTASAAGSGPDLARIDIIWTPGWGATGILEPLDRYPGFSGLKQSLFPGPLSTNRLRGQHFGLPLDTNTQVYVYNASLFSEAGTVAPRTFAEFYDVQRRLTAQQDGQTVRWGYDMGGPWNWHLLPWIWNNGGSVTDEGITTANGYLNSAPTVGALDLIQQWSVSGILAPNIAGSGFDGWGSFTSGKVAARQDGPWFAKWLEDNHQDLDVGYALMPAAPGVTPSSVVGGENIVLLSTSKAKNEAWRFTQFILTEEAQAIMARAGQMPVVRSAIRIPEYQRSLYYGVYLEQLLTAQARTPHPKYSDIEAAMQEAFGLILTGGSSARTALEEATRRVDELLK